MNVYIYSDESGVFDKKHNNYFVFGGIMLFSKDEKLIAGRRYIAAEKVIRNSYSLEHSYEVKASRISNAAKGKLYRSLNHYHKFGAVINQNQIHEQIFESKKNKQRYLDYAYKIAVKRKFENLIHTNTIDPNEIERLFFYVDEHTTATNGKYELEEALEREFKDGTFNQTYDIYYPPIFTNLKTVRVDFCDSNHKTLVRAADIVANKIYHFASEERYQQLESDLMYIIKLP